MRFTSPAAAVDDRRIERRIEQLASLTEPDRPYTRRAFTDQYGRARVWLEDEFRSAGLETRTDEGSNLIGTKPGGVPGLPTMMLGSHIDTVVGGGRFDGIAGVIAALEVAHMLHEHDVTLRHPLQIVDFISEEPSDYGASCVGSRALVGTLSPAMLEATNPSGESLAAAIRRMGGDPAALHRPLAGADEIGAYLELHIEQGPVLESEQVTIGLVQGIVAIHRLDVRIRGRAGHAGTVPMEMRRDALVGASQIVGDVWRRAQRLAKTESFVATIGRLDVHPNGINVIPGEVGLTVEARSLDVELVVEFLEETRHNALALAPELAVEVTDLSAASPVRSDPRLLAALERGCQSRGHSYRVMTSGAGHDAMHVARVAPIAMLFIPCANGVSHNPEEFAAMKDIAAGAEVMLEAVLELAGT